jgi:hypothetical protein
LENAISRGVAFIGFPPAAAIAPRVSSTELVGCSKDYFKFSSVL